MNDSSEYLDRPRLAGVRRSRTARARRLEEVGYNVWSLNPTDAELDLLTDVPSWSVAVATPDDRAAEILRAAEMVFGEALFVECANGRSAELALAAALTKRKGAPLTVLTHGLFISTDRAFRSSGAAVELIPRARAAGTSDVDLAALAERLDRGGVDVVCLEPCNNGLAGWSLSLENLRAIAHLCRKHQAMLVLDATRLLSNIAAQDHPLIETAHEFCRAADAFTVSCGKELLVSGGGLIAVREPELQRSVFEACWSTGTHLPPSRLRCELFNGMVFVARAPSLFVERRGRLRELAELLRARAIPLVDPIGGHAVFVDADGLTNGSQKHAAVALEALLFERSGIRARLTPFPLLSKRLMRLTWPVGALVETSDLCAIADGVRDLFDFASDAPLLIPTENTTPLHPLWTRFRVQQSR